MTTTYHHHDGRRKQTTDDGRRLCRIYFYDFHNKHDVHKKHVFCIFVFQQGACGGDVVTSFMILFTKSWKSSTLHFFQFPDPWQVSFTFSKKIIGIPQNFVYKMKKCRRQDLFAILGMGIKGGETMFWKYYLYIYIHIFHCFHCSNLFYTIWEKYVYKPKLNFLEMGHTKLSSSIRRTAYQPLI